MRLTFRLCDLSSIAVSRFDNASKAMRLLKAISAVRAAAVLAFSACLRHGRDDVRGHPNTDRHSADGSGR